MPGSCNSGFKSRPSKAAGISLSNGLEVNNINAKKPTLTKPITAISLILKVSGKLFANMVTAIVQIDKMATHNNMEPSCPPHTAARRYMVGNCEFEVEATYKS